jgi:hypothetical protein
MATECNEVFSGDQMYMYAVTIQRFRDCLCLHHQVEVMSDMTACCIYTHGWLSEPRVLVHEQANRDSAMSQAVSHPGHHTIYVT